MKPVLFYGKESPFSQWYPCRFTAKSSFNDDVDEIEFWCTEEWMMAEKALLFDDRKVYDRIITAATQSEIKRLGRQVRGFDDRVWKNHRYNIVLTGNRHKFKQNEDLKAVLINTGNRQIAEASKYDAIWGIGLNAGAPAAKDPLQWRGLNLLGKALMEVREELMTK